MTRTALPPRNSESPIYARQLLEREEMKVLAAWLDMRQLLWCHCPNESRAPVQYRVQMKRCGLKAGVPDVLIFQPPAEGWVPLRNHAADWPAHRPAVGVALELKAGAGRASPDQKAWLDALAQNGWLCSIQVGATAAIRWLESVGY